MSGILDLLREGAYGLKSAAQRTYEGILNNPQVDAYRMGLGERVAGLLNNPALFMRDAFVEATPFKGKVPADLIQQTQSVMTPGITQEQKDKWLNLALGGITVYHGSPHKFDKFDSSKIGTGEGAQAYGHGLYLAENPSVAKSYTSSDTRSADFFYDGKKIPYNQELRRSAAKMIELNNGDKSAIRESMGERYWNGDSGSKLWAHIESMDPSKIKSGNLYTVDLPDSAVAKMLDWDKPLSQQAPEVRNALSSIAKSTKDSAARKVLTDRSSSGEDIHKALTWLGENKDVYSDRANAADLLRKSQITGIRYLDGGSRGGGQGTSNFVVFPGNEGILKILSRE